MDLKANSGEDETPRASADAGFSTLRESKLLSPGFRSRFDLVCACTLKTGQDVAVRVQYNLDGHVADHSKTSTRIRALSRPADVAGHYLSVPGESIAAMVFTTSNDPQDSASRYAVQHHTDGVSVECPVNSALASAAQPDLHQQGTQKPERRLPVREGPYPGVTEFGKSGFGVSRGLDCDGSRGSVRISRCPHWVAGFLFSRRIN